MVACWPFEADSRSSWETRTGEIASVLVAPYDQVFNSFDKGTQVNITATTCIAVLVLLATFPLACGGHFRTSFTTLRSSNYLHSLIPPSFLVI
jgi:hypothetical protein